MCSAREVPDVLRVPGGTVSPCSICYVYLGESVISVGALELHLCGSPHCLDRLRTALKELKRRRQDEHATISRVRPQEGD